jgi:hypothetical protein
MMKAGGGVSNILVFGVTLISSSSKFVQESASKSKYSLIQVFNFLNLYERLLSGPTHMKVSKVLRIELSNAERIPLPDPM